MKDRNNIAGFGQWTKGEGNMLDTHSRIGRIKIVLLGVWIVGALLFFAYAATYHFAECGQGPFGGFPCKTWGELIFGHFFLSFVLPVLFYLVIAKIRSGLLKLRKWILGSER